MPKIPQFTQDALTADQYPNWILPLELHQINAKMMRIVYFYVLKSPCKESSWGRKSMEDYGWVNYWSSNRFRQRIYDVAELNTFNPCDSATKLKNIWPDDVNYYAAQQESAYFVTANEDSPLLNLFHRIRNSFAHGRFRINGEYYFFEDVDKSGTIVMARICLKQSTLENWIKVIDCSDVKAKEIQDGMKHKKVGTSDGKG